MSELTDKAAVEGIDFSPEANGGGDKSTTQGGNQGDSPTLKTTDTANTQAKGTDTTPAGKVEAPFHEHPRFKQLTQQASQYKKQIEAQERRAAELEAKLNGFMAGSRPSQPSLGNEDEQALDKLMNMMAQHPKFQERFGIGELKQLKEAHQAQQQAQINEKFDAEFNQIGELAKANGLDPEEVKQNLLEQFTNEDGIWGKRDYRPGMLKSAYRDLYFDQIGEMKEREANRKLIAETEAKKKANVEGPGNPNANGNGRREGESNLQFMQRRVSEGGGITF